MMACQTIPTRIRPAYDRYIARYGGQGDKIWQAAYNFHDGKTQSV